MCGSVLFVHSLSGKTLANHVSNNTHHCGTSVIKFDIQLTGLLFWVLNLKQELMQEIQNLESSSLGWGVLETLEMESKELKADNIVLKEDIAKLEDKLKGLHHQADDIKHEADLQKGKVDKLDRLYTDLECDVDDIDKDVQILNTGWWDAAIVKVNVEEGDTKLGICHGDCDADHECAANLVC